VPESAESKAMSGQLVAETSGSEPQVVSIPFAKNRGMYSHKACLPVTGGLVVGDDQIDFNPKTSFLFVDDHKGYYPYVMRWDWVVGGGFDANGRRVGFNLTRNDSIDPARYNENCLWLDGQRHLLPPVRFERQRAPGIWQVRDTGGAVQVDFEIEKASSVRVNAWLIESRYQGPLGHFRGSIVGPEGTRVPVDGFQGMGENFYLRC
jgi:hypothetical protein